MEILCLCTHKSEIVGSSDFDIYMRKMQELFIFTTYHLNVQATEFSVTHTAGKHALGVYELSTKVKIPSVLFALSGKTHSPFQDTRPY